MSKRIEEEEDIWNMEIDVEDGANALKTIFKPDYERTKELERISVYMSAEWGLIVKILKKRLRDGEVSQQGAHFIRRRLTITGLQLLYDANKEAFDKRKKEFDDELEIYNPLKCILTAQPRNLYPRERVRNSIYLKEETLGWIQDIGDMYDLMSYSVIRVAMCYAILKLIELKYLPANVNKRSEEDIALFQEYLLYIGSTTHR